MPCLDRLSVKSTVSDLTGTVRSLQEQGVQGRLALRKEHLPGEKDLCVEVEF